MWCTRLIPAIIQLTKITVITEITEVPEISPPWSEFASVKYGAPGQYQ